MQIIYIQDELFDIIPINISSEAQILKNKYDNLSTSDKRIVDFILNSSTKNTNSPQYIQTENVIYFPVFEQKASAWIGEEVSYISNNTNTICFPINKVPQNTTHGIIIEGHSMEDKFFDKQIVFIQSGVECSPSDYGIFSVTDNTDTRISCKQLVQREDGSKYLHSINKNIGYPDIDYKNVIDIHCIGKF